MKVAHLAIITPGQCGLYETARELAYYLRNEGIDSRLVDPKTIQEGSDRGVPFADAEWASNADILVNHSGLGEALEKTNQPIIHIAHGRPRHSFNTEKGGGTPVYSYHYRKNFDARFKAVVTFWREHGEYLKFMFPNKPVHYVQECVDLERWSPGLTEYNFEGKQGLINGVISDSWRDDIDPFVPINAFGLWARHAKGAKLHLYARIAELRGWSALIKRLEDDKSMGLLKARVKNLQDVYRKAHFVVTGNEINVRTVREAMACGCPVVRFPLANISNYKSVFAKALEVDRTEVRKEAERRFNPKVTAQQFKTILEAV